MTDGVRDVPERQRTIRNTIAWSYDLLKPDEKTLFARLAAFRGGRSLEALEAVCAEGLGRDVFDCLASLVNKNLLWQAEDSAGEPRFWMLETIQEFATECLEARGEVETIRKRHATCFVELAEIADTELWQSDQQHWLRLLEIELDNIRTALTWALGDHAPVLGVRLAAPTTGPPPTAAIRTSAGRTTRPRVAAAKKF
jgi:predicted ATPase